MNLLPVNPELATKSVERERPDGILYTFGGQTALNCAVQLKEQGVFEKYGIRVLGTPIQAIITRKIASFCEGRGSLQIQSCRGLMLFDGNIQE